MVSQSTFAPPELMTAEEFYDWAHLPENIDKPYELEDGEVVLMSRPGVEHGLVCWLVIALLTDYVRARRTGYILTNDTGLIVKRNPDSVRGPDVMVFMKPIPKRPVRKRHSEQTPDLVVEVYSPNDRPGKLNRRIRQYQDKGVPMIWVVYPEDRIVDVFSPGEPVLSLKESDTLSGGTALPGFDQKVLHLFEQPD